MKVGKPKSKRTPVRLRHKIEKASAAKQKKQRKLAKKNPEWRTRLKKDPGIPNLFPFKDKILAEIEEKRRLKQEEAVRRKDEARATNADAMNSDDEDAMMDGDQLDSDADEMLEDEQDTEFDESERASNPMAALLASARARAAEFDQGAKSNGATNDNDNASWDGFDEDDNEASATARQQPDSSRRAFTSTFSELLLSADVILYVLDARDPLGTRSKAIERQIMAADGGNKRLILILNKIDLIPPHVLRSWTLYLRRYFPTLPLRASNSAPNAKTFDHHSLSIKGTTESLVKALKSYGANKGLKRAISVGIIGYPNVGKSSVINALRARLGGRNDACAVGAEAGVTTNLQEVKLDGKIKLIDSPGIVFPSNEDEGPVFLGSSNRSAVRKATEKARLILLNAVPPKDIEDPVPAVDLLLKRLAKLSETTCTDPTVASPYDSMLSFYGIFALLPTLGNDGDKDVVSDFLVQVARKRGRLGKGGVPNIPAAAFTVITDWRDGRIQGWTEAPKLEYEKLEEADIGMEGTKDPHSEKGEKLKDQKKIVTSWAAEFKIEGLWGDDKVEDEASMDAE